MRAALQNGADSARTGGLGSHQRDSRGTLGAAAPRGQIQQKVTPAFPADQTIGCGEFLCASQADRPFAFTKRKGAPDDAPS